MDEIEFTGWRTWLNGPFVARVVGATITLAVWKFAPPGYAQVTAALYVAGSLAYSVWEGWDLRWAIPITTAVAGFFVLAYLGMVRAAVVSLLHGHTTCRRSPWPPWSSGRSWPA